MCDVDTNTHVGEMEPIAQPDECQCDDVVSDKLLEVLSGFLQLQHQHNRLLGPITGLEQVICLEERFMFSVRETLKHGSRVEIPNIRSFHYIKTERPENSKVDGRVDLLHESRCLAFTADARESCQGPDHTLHQKFSSERQHDRIERHESDILGAFSVHSRTTRCFRGLRI